MKKHFFILLVFCAVFLVSAFDYMPKNINENPFGDKIKNNLKTEQAIQPKLKEITTLSEYFKYLPAEIHRHWVPYKAEKDYEVTVQFVVHKNGSVSDIKIEKTNYTGANQSVLDAVKASSPLQPLPKSYNADSVKAQVILEYHKN